MVKRDDIGFQHANNVVTVKWFDNCGVTMIGTCLVECNKVSTVTRKVKRQSTKIPVPCPEIIKNYNSRMEGVDLLNQNSRLQIRTSSGGRYYLRLFFY